MFSDINISQGSVAMRLKCGGIFNDTFIANFLLNERILKIGQYLAKLWTRVWCLVFWLTVYKERNGYELRQETSSGDEGIGYIIFCRVTLTIEDSVYTSSGVYSQGDMGACPPPS